MDGQSLVLAQNQLLLYNNINQSKAGDGYGFCLSIYIIVNIDQETKIVQNINY